MLIYANFINRGNVCLPEHRPASCSSAQTADITHMYIFDHALPSKMPNGCNVSVLQAQLYSDMLNVSELSNRSTNVLQHNQELYKNAHSTHSVSCRDMTHKNYISTRFTHNHGINFPPRPSMTLPLSSKMSSASSSITSFMSFSVMSGKAIPSYPLLLFSFAYASEQ